MSQNMFSIIIPTMWMSDKLHKMLEIYENSKYVFEVIIIDNNPKNKFDLSKYKKIIYCTQNKNIYVNAAWNIGYTLSSKNLILANDDIILDNLDEVLKLFINTEYDIVGISLEKTGGKLRIENIDSFPQKSYGCFMYVKNYNYIPEKFKIWYGDQFLFETSKKRGILKNSKLITNVSETLNSNGMELRRNVAIYDSETYEREGFPQKNIGKKLKVLAVLVNFGTEQINYLNRVIDTLKSFESYDVTIYVNSNIPIDNKNIDKVNIFYNMTNYQFLPLTCRKTILDNSKDYDIFIYGENDQLFREIHLDRHIEYSKILPKNRIPGLIRYEENENGTYFPDYHARYDWDYNSVEMYNGKKFAHFTNVHQGSFILTQEQLLDICQKFDFTKFFGNSGYSVKCKVCTDIYDFCGYKKMICLSDFKDNLIHHLPNVYIDGIKGRNKNQRSDNKRMNNSLMKLLSISTIELKKEIICGVSTIYSRKDGLRESVKSIINQVDKLIVYQNGYKEDFDFLRDKKIEVISSNDTKTDMGDAGKFYNVNKYKNCYYFSIDDDLTYPPDYVTQTIETLKKFDGKVIVSYHGRILRGNATSYYNDSIKHIHFQHNQKTDDFVHFGGTGVMAFDTDYVNIGFDYFKTPNMADIWVGLYAREHNIPILCSKHNENWIKQFISFNDAIYSEYSKKDFGQNDLIKNFNKTIILKYEVTKTIEKNNEIDYQQKKQEKRELLQNILGNKKTIDYDKINELTNRVVGYDVNSSKKPMRAETPQKKEEINELRKDSLAKIARDFSKMKESRRKDLPNIFSKKR